MDIQPDDGEGMGLVCFIALSVVVAVFAVVYFGLI